jgi:hypothetical protein
VKTVAFIVVVMVGIVGNILLLGIVLRNRSMRTPTNLLIANMAVADLATLVILPWVFICMDCFQNYILGEIGCKAQGFLECEYDLCIICLNIRRLGVYCTMSAFGCKVIPFLCECRTRLVCEVMHSSS